MNDFAQKIGTYTTSAKSPIQYIEDGCCAKRSVQRPPSLAGADRSNDFPFSSGLWSRIQQAENVTVEKPIDGLVTIDDVEIEIHGTCDFVVEMHSGEWYADDVKITLTDQTPETRRRYELQVTAYSYIFEQQKHSKNSINRAVETFGVERETVESSWPSEIVERRLAALVRQ